MIPSIYNIIQKFSGKDQKKSGKLEKAAVLKNKEKSFSNILFEKRIEDIVIEYENQPPETLTLKIDEVGKRFKNSRKQEDLEEYKELLASFIVLVERKAYKIKIINKKKDLLSEDEIDYIILEIEKRLVALMESFLSSQSQILSLIDEIEGLIFKITV